MPDETPPGASATAQAPPGPPPWYLRPVPRPVAAVLLAPLVLLLVVPALFVAAALVVLVAAPGLGFVYLLFPESAFSPHPWHFAVGFVLGAAIWAFLLRASTVFSRWFAYSSPKKQRSAPPAREA